MWLFNDFSENKVEDDSISTEQILRALLASSFLTLLDAGGGAQWAKSGGEAVQLELSDVTKDLMHDFNRFFCRSSCDCEFRPDIMYLLEYKP